MPLHTLALGLFLSVASAQAEPQTEASLLAIAEGNLKTMGLPVQHSGGNLVAVVQHPTSNTTTTLVVRAREADEQLIFYGLSPSIVPAARRADVAEYLHRANLGMVLGNFEFDVDSGQVRYKAAIDVSGGTLTGTMVSSVATTVVVSAHRYESGLVAVINETATAKQAIAQVEGAPAPQP